MRKKISVGLALTFGVLTFGGWVFAHHSDSEFNKSGLVTKKVTITKFDWINPHVIMHFEAEGDNDEWAAYGGPPNRMTRERWNSQTLKPGDKLTVTGYPSKYGRKIMWFLKVVRDNGEVLRDRQD